MHQTSNRASNPFAYPKPITLDTLDDLFAHHHRQLAGWRMDGSEDDGKPGSGGEGDEGKGGKSGAATNDDEFTPITSQEEFNKRLSDRLRRERDKIQGQFADYEVLKKKADAHDKAVDEARTDQEKAVEAARKEGETSARTQADTRIIRSEAKVALATAKARNAGAAVKLLDLTGLTVDDDGEVDPKALKAKVEELQESDPYLFDDGKGDRPKPDPSQGGGSGNDGAKSVKQVMDDRRAARAARESAAK